MLPKSTLEVLTTLLLLLISGAQSAQSLWDFGVLLPSEIRFFDEKWNKVNSAAHRFEQLSALTFDEAEEIIYFSDRMHNNGSIFSLKLSLDTEDKHNIEKVVERTQNESINSIAYDPLNRNIFWIDRLNKRIYYVSIDEAANTNPKIFIDFANEEHTQADSLAIDVCRRKLYWTNSFRKNASIERINLDGSNREVIVKTAVYLPHGIVVDQLTDRIYWVDDQEGIYFTVESANLDGTDRQIIVRDDHKEPFDLVVRQNAIFWTDSLDKGIFSHTKYANSSVNLTGNQHTDILKPRKVLELFEQPRSIITRTRYLTILQGHAKCSAVVEAIKSRLLEPKPTRDPIHAEILKMRQDYCLNGGEFIDKSGMCLCNMGYKGARCEQKECHNYCVHGSCSMSSMGLLQCSCQRGFYGARCEEHKCADYCLNGGACKIEENGDPMCDCSVNFDGLRCEQNLTEICSMLCRIQTHEPDIIVPFGCHQICKQLRENANNETEVFALPDFSHLEACTNNVIWSGTLIITLVFAIALCLTLLLLIVHCLRRFYKPKRPRIRKTFVVRKQATVSSDTGTPLTNRPIATEQCEITIENCCNMNICDTPCFDPKLVQQSLSNDANVKEDKKMLIHNLEDELY